MRFQRRAPSWTHTRERCFGESNASRERCGMQTDRAEKPFSIKFPSRAEQTSSVPSVASRPAASCTCHSQRFLSISHGPWLSLVFP